MTIEYIILLILLYVFGFLSGLIIEKCRWIAFLDKISKRLDEIIEEMKE